MPLSTLATWVKVVITMLLAGALFATAAVLYQRRSDLTFFDNRVAGTARTLIGNDRPQTLTMRRDKVSAAVLMSTGVQVRSSDGTTTDLPSSEPGGRHFDLDAVSLDEGARLLKTDSSITELRVVATDDARRPDVSAVHRDGTVQKLTMEFHPA